MIKFYEPKPCVIEAIRFSEDNIKEIVEWGNGKISVHRCIVSRDTIPFLLIETREGPITAAEGHFIVKSMGEFHSYKPDAFNRKFKEIRRAN